MRMLSASKLCFAILLISFQCHTRTKAEVSPRHDNMILDGEGYRNEIRCSWNCTVTDSDFPEQRKTVLAHPNRLIKLVVMYEKKVDEKCVNQTSLSSNRVVAENWQIWQPENFKSSSFARAVDSVLNVIFSSYFREHRKIIAVCNFKPIRKTAESPTYNNDSVPSQFIRGHLADLGLDSKSMDCNIEKIEDLQPHINISNSTGNNIDSLFKQNNGLTDTDIPLQIFVFMFVTAFFYYSPAFLCLFSPTMVTENGVRQISLEGASPVSLRSLLGNYFFSEVDTLWHRIRTLILRAVVVPLPFLAPAIIFNYMVVVLYKETLNVPLLFRILDLSQPLKLTFFAGYFLQAIFDSYVSRVKKPCLVCRTVKPNFNCNDELPRRILNHLRIQPLVLVKCWRLFSTCLVCYFKMSQIILPSWKVSTAWFLRIPLLLVFLSTIPAVAVTLLVTLALVVVFIIICLTSPLSILGDAAAGINVCGSVVTRLTILLCVRIFIRLPAAIAAALILLNAALGVVLAIAVLFILLFSEKGLPLVACFVLVCYYLWSGYSSFTNKYHDLSLTLFKFYKTSQHEQISSEELLIIMDPVQDVTPNHWDKTGHVVRIPKGLFDMACEELMPIREGVCKLLLEVTIILSFVFLTFWLIMKLDVSATPVTKALVTFFTGSFPKIVVIYFDGERQRKVEATITEEKAPKIVQDYVRGTPVIYEI